MCSTVQYKIQGLEHLSLRKAEGQGDVVRGPNGASNKPKKRAFFTYAWGVLFLSKTVYCCILDAGGCQEVWLGDPLGRMDLHFPYLGFGPVRGGGFPEDGTVVFSVYRVCNYISVRNLLRSGTKVSALHL